MTFGTVGLSERKIVLQGLKAWRVVGLLCVPGLFLAGCVGSDSSAGGASAQSSGGSSRVHDVISLDFADGGRVSSLSDRYSGPVPDFSGPYAEDFVWVYRGTTTDLQRRILDDEKITEQERAELKSVFESCNLSAHNQKVVWGTRDQYSHVYLKGAPKENWSEEIEPLSKEERLRMAEEEWRADPCDPLTVRAILDLYWTVRSNPENGDFPTIIAACLVRKGLRPKGYTAEDYKREGEKSLDDPFWSCHDDPLGLLGDDIKP